MYILSYHFNIKVVSVSTSTSELYLKHPGSTQSEP